MTKATKVAVLGVDAMDPRLTRKYVDMGIMPNTKKILEMGAARQDLMLLGALPTVTPPQWTTLATGAYPETHGITAFYRQGGADSAEERKRNRDDQCAWAADDQEDKGSLHACSKG